MVVYPVAFSATIEFRDKYVDCLPKRERSAYIRSAIRLMSELLAGVEKNGSVTIDKETMRSIWIDESNIITPKELK